MEMNTIGKILVILNFIFALVVGGFLIIDFATRTNWKTAYDSLKSDMDRLKASRDASSTVAANVVVRTKQVELQMKELEQKLADAEIEAKVQQDNLVKQLEDANQKQKGTDQTLQRSLSDLERIKNELKDRDNTVREREKSLVDALAARNQFRAEAIAQEGRSKALQERNEQLMEQVLRLTQDVAKERSGGTNGAAGTPIAFRNSNQPNPPAVRVRGKVEKVDSDLVQLSVGSDQGLNKYNTLYAFRFRPSPKYLGMVQIIEVHPGTSVGRLITTPGTPRHALVEGDEVSSELGN
jgi:hypothetical protein